MTSPVRRSRKGGGGEVHSLITNNVLVYYVPNSHIDSIYYNTIIIYCGLGNIHTIFNTLYK